MNQHETRDAIYRFTGRHPRLRPFAAAVLSCASLTRARVRGMGNRLECRSAFLRNVRLSLVGDNNTVRIGAGARLSDMSITVTGSGHTLEIGADCMFKAGSICMEDCDGTLRIGPDTTIEEAHVAVTEPGSTITIGRDCMLAFGIDIRCGDSHAIMDRKTGARINKAADIRIGDHVWIGGNAQVLKGVVVGDGSVIGARSVVTGIVPPGAIVAGAPAQVVREDIVWSRQR